MKKMKRIQFMFEHLKIKKKNQNNGKNKKKGRKWLDYKYIRQWSWAEKKNNIEMLENNEKITLLEHLRIKNKNNVGILKLWKESK